MQLDHILLTWILHLSFQRKANSNTYLQLRIEK
jgi:hypothetical protein